MKVRQYNLKGKYIRSFDCVKAAAASTVISLSSTSTTLENKTYSCLK